MGRNLAAQLTANGTTAPCHQDSFPVDKTEYAGHIRLDRFPAQKVLHRNLPHGADLYLS